VSQIKIIKPDKSEEFINLSENQDRDYLTYSNTNVAGSYKFYAGGNLIEDISINTDPTESRIDYATESEFKDYLKEIKFKGDFVSIDKEVTSQKKFFRQDLAQSCGDILYLLQFS